MNKWLQIAIGALAAGLVQFGILTGAGVTDWLQLAGGIAGAVGSGIVLHMKQLPRDQWPEEKRKEQET
jgi:hypothetical protein